MLESAKRDRKQADYIELKAFEKNANKVFALTQAQAKAAGKRS